MTDEANIARSMCLRWVATNKCPGFGRGIILCRADDVTLDAVFDDTDDMLPSIVLLQFLQGLAVWNTGATDIWRVFLATPSSNHWELRFLDTDLCEIRATWSYHVARVRRQTLVEAIFGFAEQLLSGRSIGISYDDKLLDHPDWWPEAEEYIGLLLAYCQEHRP